MQFKNIEAEQVRAGFTQEEIAKKLNITRKTYRHWIDGGSIPASKLCELSDLFGCSIDYLLGRSEVRKYKIQIVPENQIVAQEEG